MHACLKNGKNNKQKKCDGITQPGCDFISFFFFFFVGIIETSHFHQNIVSDCCVFVSFSVVFAVVDVWFFSMIRLSSVFPYGVTVSFLR